MAHFLLEVKVPDTPDKSDTPDKGFRERFLSGAAGNPLLSQLRRVIPGSLRRAIVTSLSGDRLGTMDLGNGAVAQYPLSDTYWRGYGANPRKYEPEIWALTDRFANADTVFVDCGANLGMWSCYAAKKIGNKDQVIAVEAGDEIGKMLAHNHRLNGESFTLMPNAVWDKAGETLTFHVSTRHAGSSLVEDAVDGHEGTRPISVKTTSIDSIVDAAFAKRPNANNVIVKLDVEGVECKAMDGAVRTLGSMNAMVVYEDHGKEKTSETTAEFLRRGLKVFYVDDDSKVMAVTSAKQLEPIKTNRHKGYNFVACPVGCDFERELSRLSVGNQPLGSGAHAAGLPPKRTSWVQGS